jgi:DNA mismatch repair protein MutS
MLVQYLEYKEKHPDSLIFMQVGDFYELFFDDAKVVSQVLGITLTSRDKSSATPIPMCGVPVAVIDGYVDRLVEKGHSVALVSQVGDVPAKGMVPRALERIVTPGIRLLGGIVNSETTRAIVAALVIFSHDDAHLAWTNINDGIVVVRSGIPFGQLINEIERIGCSELVICRVAGGEVLDGRSAIIRHLERRLTIPLKIRGSECLEESGLALNLEELNLEGLNTVPPFTRKAVFLLLHFLAETTVDISNIIARVVTKRYDGFVAIDAETRRSLELVRNIRDGTQRGTLFEHLNQTVTTTGSTLLWEWILHPLTDIQALIYRQEAVQALISDNISRSAIQAILREAPPLARLAARIGSRVAGPRELAALRDFIQNLHRLRDYLDSFSDQVSLLKNAALSCDFPSELCELLKISFLEEPAPFLREGGIIADGVSSDIDELRAITKEQSAWISQFEQSERERTGISSLKIKYNGVLGYFIEVTNSHLKRVPPEYIRRQSTTQGERFIVPWLKEKEREAFNAQTRLVQLEKELFIEIREKLVPAIPTLRVLDSIVALVDVLSSLATVSVQFDYVRPTIVHHNHLIIDGGRHPVVSARLNSRFVPNSLFLCEKEKTGNFDDDGHKGRIGIITGPNMGGKSTFLRQNALIVVMAQIGSFVPVRSATIGIIDAIFARIGSADDIHEGESTFMVEMREIATILAHATSKSLVLIDEIGRGTATLDGLALARSILEWIVHRIECKTLFATHFHELTSLYAKESTLVNLTVGVDHGDDGPIFTHKIVPGVAYSSYGLEVAKRAGLPEELLDRARMLAGINNVDTNDKDLSEPRTLSKGKVRNIIAHDIDVKFDTDISVNDVERLPTQQNVSTNNVVIAKSSMHEKKIVAEIRRHLSKINLFETTPANALAHLELVRKLVMGGGGVVTRESTKKEDDITHELLQPSLPIALK